MDVLRVPCHDREILHLAEDVVHHRGAQKVSVRLPGRVVGVDQFERLRRQAPVPVDVTGDDAVPDLLAEDEPDPFLHRIVAVPDHLLVAELPPEHVHGSEQGSRPGDILVPEGPVSRADVGDAAILPHGFLDVERPLAVEILDIVDEGLAVAAGGAVAQPAHPLVPLRAVGRHSAVVSAKASGSVLVHQVEYLVGAGESSGGLHLIVGDYSGKIPCGRHSGQICSADLDETESVDHELRLPLEPSVGSGSVGIHAAGEPEVGDIELLRVVAAQDFRIS